MSGLQLGTHGSGQVQNQLDLVIVQSLQKLFFFSCLFLLVFSPLLSSPFPFLNFFFH